MKRMVGTFIRLFKDESHTGKKIYILLFLIALSAVARLAIWLMRG